MKKILISKMLDSIYLNCDADARSVIEHELEVDLSHTGPSVQEALDFTRYI